MASTIFHCYNPHHRPILILFSLSFLLLPSMPFSSEGIGFSLELIHRDSPHSPFFNPNLTDTERFLRLIQSSESRLRWLEYSSAVGPTNITDSVNVSFIRPPLVENSQTYMVRIGIGTASGQQQYLLNLDTCGDVTWMQCVPCNPGFSQSSPLFNPTLSPSYDYIPCDHPICSGRHYRCIHHKCYFRVKYIDDTYSAGFVSKESFYFHTGVNDQIQQINNLIFGCAHATTASYRSGAAGILGLNLMPISFSSQLVNLIDGRFSYCLFPPGLNVVGSLRFGHDITFHGPTQQTTILRWNNIGNYHLNLRDISINDQRMNFDPTIFARRNNRTGGCIIDSGSTISWICKPAYDTLVSFLTSYFRGYSLHPVDRAHNPLSLDLCYRMQASYESVLPTMTFHFLTANLQLQWQEVFYVDNARGLYCLAMKRSDVLSVIGAFQQHNTRFMFDVVNSELTFGPENCALAH